MTLEGIAEVRQVELNRFPILIPNSYITGYITIYIVEKLSEYIQLIIINFLWGYNQKLTVSVFQFKLKLFKVVDSLSNSILYPRV